MNKNYTYEILDIKQYYRKKHDERFKINTPVDIYEFIKEDKKLLLETRITEILSRLSIEPSEELEKEFQNLINEKRNLDN